MDPVITEHQAKIADVCQRHKILRLEAYDLPYKIGPKESPYEVAFVADFAQISSHDPYTQLVSLAEDLGKVLSRRVWISEFSSLKIDADIDNNPYALRVLKIMEPVYGNGASGACAARSRSAAA